MWLACLRLVRATTMEDLVLPSRHEGFKRYRRRQASWICELYVSNSVLILLSPLESSGKRCGPTPWIRTFFQWSPVRIYVIPLSIFLIAVLILSEYFITSTALAVFMVFRTMLVRMFTFAAATLMCLGALSFKRTLLIA